MTVPRLAALPAAGLVASLIAVFIAVLPANARTTRAVTTTQFAEIEVALDTTIKGIRALAADCTREGNRWAAKWRREAAKALREEPQMQERGVHWALQREYETRSVIGRYVSVLRRYVSLELGIVVGLALLATGFGLTVYSVIEWERARYGAFDPIKGMRIVIPALTVTLVGIQVLFASLFLGVLDLKVHSVPA